MVSRQEIADKKFQEKTDLSLQQKKEKNSIWSLSAFAESNRSWKRKNEMIRKNEYGPSE